MSKSADLTAIYRLEFYQNQQNWKFRKEPAKLKTKETPLDQTYNLEKIEQTLPSLNDAFLECSDKDLPLSEPSTPTAAATKTTKSCPNTSRKPDPGEKPGGQKSPAKPHPKSPKPLFNKRLKSPKVSKYNLRDTKSSPKYFPSQKSSKSSLAKKESNTKVSLLNEKDVKDCTSLENDGKSNSLITNKEYNTAEKVTGYKSKIPVSANSSVTPRKVTPKKVTRKGSKTDGKVQNSPSPPHYLPACLKKNAKVVPFPKEETENHSEAENQVTENQNQEIKERSTDDHIKPVRAVKSSLNDVKVELKVEQKFTATSRLQNLEKLAKLELEKEGSIQLSSPTTTAIDIWSGNDQKSPLVYLLSNNDHQGTPAWSYGPNTPGEWPDGRCSPCHWPNDIETPEGLWPSDPNTPIQWPNDQKTPIQWPNGTNTPEQCNGPEGLWPNDPSNQIQWPNDQTKPIQWSTRHDMPENQWSNGYDMPENQWSNGYHMPENQWPNGPNTQIEQWPHDPNTPECPNGPNIPIQQWPHDQNTPVDCNTTVGQWSIIPNAPECPNGYDISLDLWPNDPNTPECPNGPNMPLDLWPNDPNTPECPNGYDIPLDLWPNDPNMPECPNGLDMPLDLCPNDPNTPECFNGPNTPVGQWPNGQIWPQSPRNWPEPTTWHHMVWKEALPDIDQVGTFGSERPWPVLTNGQIAETLALEGIQLGLETAGLSDVTPECALTASDPNVTDEAEFMRGAHRAPHSSETDIHIQYNWPNTQSTLDAPSPTPTQRSCPTPSPSGSSGLQEATPNGSRSPENQESVNSNIQGSLKSLTGIKESVSKISNVLPSGLKLLGVQERQSMRLLPGSQESMKSLTGMQEPVSKFSTVHHSELNLPRCHEVFNFADIKGSKPVLNDIKCSNVRPSTLALPKVQERVKNIHGSMPSLQNIPTPGKKSVSKFSNVQGSRFSLQGTQENVNHNLPNSQRSIKQRESDSYESAKRKSSNDVFFAGSYNNDDRNTESLKNDTKRTGVNGDPKHADFNNLPQDTGSKTDVKHTGYNNDRDKAGSHVSNSVNYIGSFADAVKANLAKNVKNEAKGEEHDNFEVDAKGKFLNDVILAGSHNNKENVADNAKNIHDKRKYVGDITNENRGIQKEADIANRLAKEKHPSEINIGVQNDYPDGHVKNVNVEYHGFDYNQNNVNIDAQYFKNNDRIKNIIQNAQNPNVGVNYQNYIRSDENFQYVKYSDPEFDIQNDIDNNNCKYILDQNLQGLEHIKINEEHIKYLQNHNSVQNNNNIHIANGNSNIQYPQNRQHLDLQNNDYRQNLETMENAFKDSYIKNISQRHTNNTSETSCNISSYNTTQNSRGIDIPRNIPRELCRRFSTNGTMQPHPNLGNIAVPDEVFTYPSPKHDLKTPQNSAQSLYCRRNSENSENSAQSMYVKSNSGENSAQSMYRKSNSGESLENMMLIPPHEFKNPRLTQYRPRPNMPYGFSPKDERPNIPHCFSPQDEIFLPSVPGYQFETHGHQSSIAISNNLLSDRGMNTKVHSNNHNVNSVIGNFDERVKAYFGSMNQGHVGILGQEKAGLVEKENFLAQNNNIGQLPKQLAEDTVDQDSQCKTKSVKVSDQLEQSFKAKDDKTRTITKDDEKHFLKNLIMLSRNNNLEKESNEYECNNFIPKVINEIVETINFNDRNHNAEGYLRSINLHRSSEKLTDPLNLVERNNVGSKLYNYSKKELTSIMPMYDFMSYPNCNPKVCSNAEINSKDNRVTTAENAVAAEFNMENAANRNCDFQNGHFASTNKNVNIPSGEKPCDIAAQDKLSNQNIGFSGEKPCDIAAQDKLSNQNIGFSGNVPNNMKSDCHRQNIQHYGGKSSTDKEILQQQENSDVNRFRGPNNHGNTINKDNRQHIVSHNSNLQDQQVFQDSNREYLKHFYKENIVDFNENSVTQETGKNTIDFKNPKGNFVQERKTTHLNTDMTDRKFVKIPLNYAAENIVSREGYKNYRQHDNNSKNLSDLERGEGNIEKNIPSIYKGEGNIEGKMPSNYKGEGKMPSNYKGEGKMPSNYKGEGMMPSNYKGEGKMPSNYKGEGKIASNYKGEGKMPSNYKGEGKMPSNYKGDGNMASNYKGEGKIASNYKGEGKMPSNYKGEGNIERNLPSNNKGQANIEGKMPPNYKALRPGYDKKEIQAMYAEKDIGIGFERQVETRGRGRVVKRVTML